MAFKLAAARAYLSEQVDTLNRKADHLDSGVRAVGAEVGRTRAEVAGVAAGVRELEGAVADANASLGVANEGIYLLCRVVCELLRPAGGGHGPKSAAAAALERYVKRQRGLASRVPGLEGLLLGGDGADDVWGPLAGRPGGGGGGLGGYGLAFDGETGRQALPDVSVEGVLGDLGLGPTQGGPPPRAPRTPAVSDEVHCCMGGVVSRQATPTATPAAFQWLF